MNAHIAIVIGICLSTVGCSAVRHQPPAFLAAGSALPVEVKVKHKPQETVSGVIHHRRVGSAAYQTTTMQVRADQLWTLLPTEHLQPSQQVEYFIDVNKAGTTYPLGSPGSPYVVTILDPTQMVLNKLNSRPIASDSDHEVRIVLLTAGQMVSQPMVVYQIPGVPGDIRSPMEDDGLGNYQLVVDPFGVQSGTWKYAIEVPINGETRRLPELGFKSFVVKTAAESQVAAGE